MGGAVFGEKRKGSRSTKVMGLGKMGRQKETRRTQESMNRYGLEQLSGVGSHLNTCLPHLSGVERKCQEARLENAKQELRAKASKDKASSSHK